MYPDDRFSTPPIGAKFRVVRPLNASGDTLIIRYLKWTRTKDTALERYYNEPLKFEWDSINKQSPGNQHTGVLWPEVSGKKAGKDSGWINLPNEEYGNKIDKYFLIRRYDLDSNCVKVYNTGLKSTVFTIGLVTMPLKLRLGANFDFQGNLSLGSTAGAKIRLSKYSSNFINLLLGTSISTITLDSFNTKGRIAGQPITNIAVFSPSLGAVFEFGKAQAGIFYGWDIHNSQTQTK